MSGQRRVDVGVGLVTGALIAGGTLTVLRDNLEFQAELSLSDVLGGLLAVGIAYAIGHVLQKRTDRSKVEKERLVTRTEELAARAAQLRSKQLRLKDGSVDLSEVLAEARGVATELAGLRDKLRIYEVLGKVDVQVGAVEQALAEYRVPIGESSLIEGAPTAASLDRAYRKLTNEIDTLIRDISRLD